MLGGDDQVGMEIAGIAGMADEPRTGLTNDIEAVRHSRRAGCVRDRIVNRKATDEGFRIRAVPSLPPPSKGQHEAGHVGRRRGKPPPGVIALTNS